MSTLTWAQLSGGMNRIFTTQRNEWCGVPMPLPGFSLEIEEKNPHREMFLNAEAAIQEKPLAHTCSDADLDLELVNQWWSRRLRCTVLIVRDGGKTSFGLDGFDISKRCDFLIRTMQAAQAWSIKTETTAMEKLATLLKPHIWEAYIHTGTFLETSRRSGITYVFRRCRPTLAIHATTEGSRILAALCLHPIAYYKETHAGGMTPTDDVIAHLMLMRGDEHMFWRRSNQHPPDRPEAGL